MILGGDGIQVPSDQERLTRFFELYIPDPTDPMRGTMRQVSELPEDLRDYWLMWRILTNEERTKSSATTRAAAISSVGLIGSAVVGALVRLGILAPA